LDRAGVVEITRDKEGDIVGFKEKINLDFSNETKTFEPSVSNKEQKPNKPTGNKNSATMDGATPSPD
jgi:hypothetical protein